MRRRYFVKSPEIKRQEKEAKTSTTCANCGLVSQSQYGLMKHEREGCPALRPKPPTKSFLPLPPLPLEVHPDEAPIGVGSVPCYLCGTFLKNAQALKKHEKKTCPRRPKPEKPEGDQAAGCSKPKAAPPPAIGVLCDNCGVYCKSQFILSKHEPHCSQKPRCGSCGLYFYKKEHRDEHEKNHCEANREDDFEDVFPVSSIAVKPATAPKRKGIDLLADCPVLGRPRAVREPEDEAQDEEEDEREEEAPTEAKRSKVELGSTTRKYGCMFCEMVFPTPTQRSTHEVREHWKMFLRMQQEHGVRPRTRHFKCHGCTKRFDSFAERSAHVAEEHPVPCLETSGPPRSINVLVKGSARCTKCKKIYKSAADRDKHISMEHSDPSPTPAVIKCAYCRKKFNSEEERDDHMKTEHTDSNYFNKVCFVCKKYFRSKEERLEHMREEHEGVDMPSVADIKAKYAIGRQEHIGAVQLMQLEEEGNILEHEGLDEDASDDVMPPTEADLTLSLLQSTSGVSLLSEDLVKQEIDADFPPVICVENVKDEPPEDDDGLPYFQQSSFDWRNDPDLPRAYFTCSFCPKRFRTADEKNSHQCGNSEELEPSLFREVSDLKQEVKEEPVDDVSGEASGSLPVAEDPTPQRLPILKHAQLIAILAITNSVKKSLFFQEICLFASVYFTPLYSDVPNLEEVIAEALGMANFTKIGEDRHVKYEIAKSYEKWKRVVTVLMDDFHDEPHKRMNDETLWPKMRAGLLRWDKNIVNGDSLL